MPLSTTELASARQAVGALLEQLGLEAYLFELEPAADQWQLRLECAVAEGWQTLAWPVDKAVLLDPARREALLPEWRGKLAACKAAGR